MLSCLVCLSPMLSISCVVYLVRLSCSVLSCLILSCSVLSCLILFCLVLSYPVLSCLVLFCLVLSYSVLRCLCVSCIPSISCVVLVGLRFGLSCVLFYVVASRLCYMSRLYICRVVFCLFLLYSPLVEI